MNKKTTTVGSYKVSLEEAPMKLKVEHESNFFMFRIFAGEKVNMVFDTWKQNASAFTQIFDVLYVVTASALNLPDYADKLRKFHLDYTEGMVKAAPVLTKEEDDKILKEVQDEYEARVADEKYTRSKAETDVWMDKGIIDEAMFEARVAGDVPVSESGVTE